MEKGLLKLCFIYFLHNSNMQGLKTGMYYLRIKAAVQAIQFTVDKLALKQNNKQRAAKLSSMANGDTLKMEEQNENVNGDAVVKNDKSAAELVCACVGDNVF
jgi:hypothetical protein